MCTAAVSYTHKLSVCSARASSWKITKKQTNTSTQARSRLSVLAHALLADSVESISGETHVNAAQVSNKKSMFC